MDILALLRTDPHLAAAPDPARLGRRMAALYRCWDRPGALDLVALAAGLLARLGCADTPIGLVCLRLAGDVAAWGGHAYHSSRHHAEVATNAMVLTEIASRIGQPVPPHRRAMLLAAALAHDIGYEPLPAPRARFAAETSSARLADAIGAGHGLDAADRAALRCLILATEPGFRALLADLPRRPGASPDLPAPLRPLAAQPALAGLAAVLSDADLLSSAGLTLRWHRVQLARLARELGQPIPPADDLRFFERIVGDDFLSPGGRLFSPNLACIRQAVRAAAVGA
jgi:hypothetical protein